MIKWDTVGDRHAAPVDDLQVFLISGTGLSQEPGRSATLYAAEVTRAASGTVVLDLDFRPDQWDDPRSFAVNMRSALRLVDIAPGTDEEINAAILSEASQIRLTDSQVSDARVSGDVNASMHGCANFTPTLPRPKRLWPTGRVVAGQALALPPIRATARVTPTMMERTTCQNLLRSA